jgi:hypothetical protein
MKKREIEDDPYRIQRLISYMDFATKLKIAQEDNKRKRNKKKRNSNK